MQNYPLTTVAGLVDIIGAGNPDPSASGPVVVQATLMEDKRVVKGCYYKGPKTPDITSKFDVIMDDIALRKHVDALMKDGTSFITETGTSDMVCTLEWTIHDPE